MSEICKLCDEERPLQQSHAIPDSIFRRLFQADSGKAILLNTNSEGIEYTSDSLDTPQLCSQCEALINENYEAYSIDTLRNRRKNVSKSNHGITFNEVDANKFRMFFIAIFWRAANSNHKSYGGAVMPIEFFANDTNALIKKAIINNSPVPTSIISIKIQRLVDSQGVFDRNTLKGILVTPFHRPYGPQNKVSVCFVIEGFLVTLIMPGLTYKERKADSLIDRDSRLVVAEFVEIFGDPTIGGILLAANHKATTKQSRITQS